jgi:hypothetical protein
MLSSFDEHMQLCVQFFWPPVNGIISINEDSNAVLLMTTVNDITENNALESHSETSLSM